MSRRDRIDGVLYDGETVAERLTCGTATVAVTSHRLLAFTPDSAGANVHAVARPNVEGIERRTNGDATHLLRAAKAGLLGLTLAGLGWFVDLDTLLPAVDGFTGTGVGMDGVLATIRTLFGLIRLLDDVLLAVGSLALVAASALTGWYVRTREPALVIAIAGAENVRLPPPTESGTVTRLRSALQDAGRPQPPATNANERAPTDADEDTNEDVVTFEDLVADREESRRDA